MWTVSLTYQRPWSQSRGERGSASVRAAHSGPPRTRLLCGLGCLVFGHSQQSTALVPTFFVRPGSISTTNLPFVSSFLLFLPFSLLILSWAAIDDSLGAIVGEVGGSHTPAIGGGFKDGEVPLIDGVDDALNEGIDGDLGVVVGEALNGPINGGMAGISDLNGPLIMGEMDGMDGMMRWDIGDAMHPLSVGHMDDVIDGDDGVMMDIDGLILDCLLVPVRRENTLAK
jgi:hypothetical protein